MIDRHTIACCENKTEKNDAQRSCLTWLSTQVINMRTTEGSEIKKGVTTYADSRSQMTTRNGHRVPRQYMSEKSFRRRLGMKRHMSRHYMSESRLFIMHTAFEVHGERHDM